MALRIDDVDLQRDRILVERFQEGDAGAFDALYLRYFSRLQRFCLKRVGDPLEAEEIAQEAFTRAYRALPGLAGERRFYPWMTVIAGRLCIDHHRRSGRTEPSDDIDMGSVDGGQEAIVEQADFALLTKALDRLAPRHREVLDMREHRGWTYQQIADHYEVPLGTVEALLFRARKALRREFFAVAGSDRLGGFAAIPIFGAAVRKIASWKARLAALAPSGGLAPVLGVAAIVGSVAVAGGVIDSALSPDTRPDAVVATRHATTATTISELLADPGSAVDGAGSSHAAAPPADRVAPVDDGLAGPPPVLEAQIEKTTVGDYGSASDRAARDTTVIERPVVLGQEVLVGLAPDQFTDDLSRGVDDLKGYRQ